MPRLPLADAVERLQSPYALEAFSPLGGAPILIVDCRGPERVAADSLAIAGARLGEVACPTVAIVVTGMRLSSTTRRPKAVSRQTTPRLARSGWNSGSFAWKYSSMSA